MKQFFYTLLILGLIYFCYWYITRPPDIIKVTGMVRVLEEISDTGFYKATIQGTAENVGNFTAKEIWIVYSIGNDEVSAYISELKPKQKQNFRTGISQVKNKKPGFELISVEYSK